MRESASCGFPSLLESKGPLVRPQLEQYSPSSQGSFMKNKIIRRNILKKSKIDKPLEIDLDEVLD